MPTRTAFQVLSPGAPARPAQPPSRPQTRVSGARRRSARVEVSCPVLAPRGLRREPRRPLRPRSQWPFTCYSDKPVGTPCRSRGAGPAGSTSPATLRPPSQIPPSHFPVNRPRGHHGLHPAQLLPPVLWPLRSTLPPCPPPPRHHAGPSPALLPPTGLTHAHTRTHAHTALNSIFLLKMTDPSLLSLYLAPNRLDEHF